jgi:hypothetical protein
MKMTVVVIHYFTPLTLLRNIKQRRLAASAINLSEHSLQYISFTIDVD